MSNRSFRELIEITDLLDTKNKFQQKTIGKQQNQSDIMTKMDISLKDHGKDQI